jgi:demethylmenaquinone methyltransferase/2-methoxy-6-polyprenyl-1,4-benzoquinol methylase
VDRVHKNLNRRKSSWFRRLYLFLDPGLKASPFLKKPKCRSHAKPVKAGILVEAALAKGLYSREQRHREPGLMPLPHAKTESYRIFDAIAGRYDVINTVLSGGLHRIWRRAMRRSLPQRLNLTVLDLATGTGDVALELIKNPHVQKVRGLDLSKGMIAKGREKIAAAGHGDKITLDVGDAQKIPYSDASFDAVTISFGIRNVADVKLCLSEIYRVLKPGGRVLILEFGLPRSRVLRSAHLFYLRNILPGLGRMLSGHATAYSYLNQTIEEFPYGAAFAELLTGAGFTDAQYRPMSGGIVHLYRGDKP